MQKNNDKKVPQLRFKEFGGDWEIKRYGDIYSFYTTNSLSRAKLNYEKGTVKNIHYGDIHKSLASTLDVSKELLPFINEDVDLSRIKEENYCQVNDLVIADASEDYADIGKTTEIVNLDGGRVLAGLHTFLARPDKQKMALGFTTYLVNSWFVRKQILTIAQGTKVLSLSTTRLAEVNLPVPSVPEQKKIANFLSSIDKQISLLEQKTKQLEAFKKGTIQQLLTGKKRFKEFVQEEGFKETKLGLIPKDWEVVKLSRLGKIESGGTPSTQVSSYWNGSVNWCIPTDLTKLKGAKHLEFTTKTITELGLKKSSAKILPIHSIIVCTRATIGVVAINLVETSTNQGFKSIIPNKEATNYEFIYYIVSSLKEKMINLSSGSTFLELSKKEFSNIKIPLPSLPEQKKIAACLSSIDQQIEDSRAQLAASKAYKKGLLQQLLV